MLVVNPAASSVTPRRRVLVGRELAARHDLYVAHTSRRDHATELAAEAVADGMDCVAVLGGDGTLNEVATALAGTDVALAALPGGSTNVFARTIGLPDDPVAAAARLAEALEAGSVRRIGMGEVNGRSFLFHTGVGFDAEVVKGVERRGRLKPYLGHALFAAEAVRAFFFAYGRRSPHFSVDLGDGEVIDDAYFTIVMNSDPYTYVRHRPFTVSTAATLERPFVVMTLRSLRLRRFLPVLFDALRDREGLGPHPYLDLRTDVTSLVVRRTTTMPYQVDGDHLGDADELRFTHRPDAIDLVVPIT